MSRDSNRNVKMVCSIVIAGIIYLSTTWKAGMDWRLIALGAVGVMAKDIQSYLSTSPGVAASNEASNDLQP